MATVQDLKRRIRSIRNTQKITKAFELVASARLRRAQARIETMRPYADKMLELMSGVARASVNFATARASVTLGAAGGREPDHESRFEAAGKVDVAIYGDQYVVHPL